MSQKFCQNAWCCDLTKNSSSISIFSTDWFLKIKLSTQFRQIAWWCDFTENQNSAPTIMLFLQIFQFWKLWFFPFAFLDFASFFSAYFETYGKKHFEFSDQLRFINDNAGFPPAVKRFVGPQAEEMERLSSALRKHGIDCAPLRKAYEAAFKRSTMTDASDCTHVTHRCNHAVSAYTGLPCMPGKRKFNSKIIFEM